MGGVDSKTKCKEPLNPDLLSVVTLSDSAVQRLPLEVDDSPLEKEQRNQNTDDFWRDRLECLEQTFSEAHGITEKEFLRLEFAIRKITPATLGKPNCPTMLEDTKSCYLAYPNQPLNCTHLIEKLQLCLDTIMQESAKKRKEEDDRKAKQRKPC